MSSIVCIVTADTLDTETGPVLVLTQVLSSGNKAAQCHVTLAIILITMRKAMMYFHFNLSGYNAYKMLHVIYNIQYLNLDIYSPSSVCPSVEAPHAAAKCAVHSAGALYRCFLVMLLVESHCRDC